MNYIALLGWNPGGEREIYSLEELAEVFTLEGISKSSSIFDVEKLTWMNGEYIRALSPEEFEKRARPYLDEALGGSFDYKAVCALIQPRLEVLTQIPEKVGFLKEMPDYDLSLYTHKKMKTTPENSLPVLKKAREVLAAQEDFSNDALYETLQGIAGELEVKNGRVLWPVRVAISGVAVTPGGATELAALLGKQETLARMDKSIAKLEEAVNAQ